MSCSAETACPVAPRQKAAVAAPRRARRLWNFRAPSAAAAAAAASSFAAVFGVAAYAAGAALFFSASVVFPGGGTQSFLCTGLCCLWHSLEQ